MPDAVPLTGLFGKVPAHGDFVRRGLPTSFVGPWDAWLQDGMATARDRLGDRWAALWDGAPPWRFALPAGTCGPDAVAGVLLPSADMVGRRFPITLAALLPPGAALPGPGWFAVLEAAALAGRTGQYDADALAAAIPPADAVIEAPAALSWLTAEPAADVPLPVADAMFPGDIAALDVLGDPAMAPPPRPDGTDVLDLFSGASQIAVVPPGPRDSDAHDVPGGATVAAPAAAMPMAGPPGAAVPDAPSAPAADGTLAFLLGEARADDAPPAIREADGHPDPLAALIAASDAPPLHLAATAEDAAPFAAPADAMPALDSAPMAMMPAEGPTPMPMIRAEPPAPPAGGGWWTAGGGRLPASARAWPALLPVTDFASLLETEA